MGRKRKNGTPVTIAQKHALQPEKKQMATHLLTGVDLACEGSEKTIIVPFRTRGSEIELCDPKILKAGINV
jgi:hypothetical protein